METETLKIKASLRKDYRSYNASLFHFDFPKLVDNMKHRRAWTKGELISMILLKSPDKQIVLTVMHDRTEINYFQADGSITFQIIEGKLRLNTPQESLILDKGQFLTLNDKIKYSLNSVEETVFLMTIQKALCS
jgi:quercetin dioxygenase-like cupin family protein